MTNENFSIERKIFNQLLVEIKSLVDRLKITRPSGFISYAWETNPEENKKLQEFLSQITADFKQLDIDVFLDVRQMNGSIKECMNVIKQRNFVFPIGTRRFKTRCEQDMLYLLPSWNPNVLPKNGNAVILIKDQDVVHFMENGQVLPDEKTVSRNFKLDPIKWIQESGYQRAITSEASNKIIDEAIYPISNRNINNVSFELGLTLDKGSQTSESIMPLLYEGDFDLSFPRELGSYLIRDFRDRNQYYRNFLSIGGPLGLLPALLPSLRDNAEYAKLVKDFLEWKFEVWKEQLSNRFYDELKLYIPARGDYSAECSHPKPMEEHIDDFIKNNSEKVMLILGGAGSGKTLFGQYVSQIYANNSDYTPVWVSLPSVKNPKENLVREGLEQLGVPLTHIPSFQQKHLLLILDGYDEVNDLGNLYDSNALQNFNAKVIITCRTENIKSNNYHSLFKPRNSIFLPERYIAPFSEHEIKNYFENYIDRENPKWNLDQYLSEIRKFSNLKQLIQTPFLLRIVAAILPEITEKYEGHENQFQISRKALYDEFLNHWFEKHLLRWEEQGKLSVLDRNLRLLGNGQDRHIQRIKALRDYAEKFAQNLYANKLDAISSTTNDGWVRELFSDDERTQLIRSACPLKKTGMDTYSFIHKSLLEFLVTPGIVRNLTSSNNASSSINHSNIDLLHLDKPLTPAVEEFMADEVRGNSDLQSGLWAIIQAAKPMWGFSPSEKKIIAAANAITILNRARISFSGKNLSSVWINGANLSGGFFDNANFENANLTNVNFSAAWLNGANFTNAEMQGIQFGEMRDISFSGNEISFNEKVIAILNKGQITVYNTNRDLKHTLTSSYITGVTISPDNRFIAYSDLYDNYHVDDEDPWKIKSKESQYIIVKALDENGLNTSGRRLKSKYIIKSFVFSRDSCYLAAAQYNSPKETRENSRKIQDTLLNKSIDYITTSFTYCWDSIHSAAAQNRYPVAIYNLQNDRILPLFHLKEHANEIVAMDFSNDNSLLATGSKDRTVKLWKLGNANQQDVFMSTHTFTEHSDEILSVKFNNSLFPENQLLVTSGRDKTVKVWSYNQLKLLWTIDNPNYEVYALDISDKNQILATGCSDKTVKLWSIPTRSLIKTFIGHSASVNSIKFSNENAFLMSAGYDKTIRFWSTENIQEDRVTLGSHTNKINILAFSKDGNYLGTGSKDNTAKIWLTNGTLRYTLEGHAHEITSIAFSFDSTQFVSHSVDHTVNLWAVNTGSLIKNFQLCSFLEQQISNITSGMKNLFSCPYPKFIENYTPPVSSYILQNYPSYFNSTHYISFTEDGTQLIRRVNDNIERWSIDSGEFIKSISVNNAKECALQQNRGSEGSIYLLACFEAARTDFKYVAEIKDNKVNICDTNTTIRMFRANSTLNLQKTTEIKAAAFSPCNNYLVTAANDSVSSYKTTFISLWNKYLDSPANPVSKIRVDSPASTLSFTTKKIETTEKHNLFLASGHDDGSLRYWQLMEKQTPNQNNTKEPYLQLIWSTHQKMLSFENIFIKNPKNLAKNAPMAMEETRTANEWSQATPLIFSSVVNNEGNNQNDIERHNNNNNNLRHRRQ